MVQYVFKFVFIEQFLIVLDMAFVIFYSCCFVVVLFVLVFFGSGCVLYVVQDFFFVWQDYCYVCVEVVDICWIEVKEYVVKIVIDVKVIVFFVCFKSFLEQVFYFVLMCIYCFWVVNICYVVAYYCGCVMVCYWEGMQEILLSEIWWDDFLGGLFNLWVDQWGRIGGW